MFTAFIISAKVTHKLSVSSFRLWLCDIPSWLFALNCLISLLHLVYSTLHLYHQNRYLRVSFLFNNLYFLTTCDGERWEWKRELGYHGIGRALSLRIGSLRLINKPYWRKPEPIDESMHLLEGKIIIQKHPSYVILEGDSLSIRG